MSGFKPYPAYRDSGVKWFRKVPEHWNVCRMAHLEQGGDDFVSGPFGSSLGSSDYIDEGIPVIRGVNTTLRAERKFVEEDFVFVAEEKYAELCRCNAVPGDLIFTARGTVGKVALVPGSIPMSLISPNQLRLRPGSKKVIAEYFYYMFSSENLLAEVYLSSDSVAQPNMNLGSLKAIKVMLPPPNEQTQIARYLDHETARIDALIEEQQRLIELLKEKRQAVISHAVTKGLDPTVPMKDSGVEWLGEVPAHWALVPFGLAFEYQEGPGIMAVDFRDEGVPLVRISGVQGRWVTLEGCNYLEPSKVKEKWAHFRLDKGDLIISGSASMGLVSEVGEDAAGAVAYTGLIRLKPRANISIRDFIRSVVGSYQFHAQIDLLKAGSTIQHFGPTHLSQMKVVLPPVNEQAQIAAYVDTISVQFDELLGEAENTNALLQERRSALISAAVTGKIDVRGWQPPAINQAPKLEVTEAN